MQDCIFCKIVSGEIPAEFTYQDDLVAVFPDIHPMAPIHLLIIPKVHIKEFYEVTDDSLFIDMGKVVKKMIEDNGLQHKGYRIEINGGGNQDVDHLHIHLMGPKKRTPK